VSGTANLWPATGREPSGELTAIADDGCNAAAVDYRDLDLTTKAGRVVLQQRVARAAAGLLATGSTELDLKPGG
jgi:hypothetical protein